jgi:spore coat polysaccharide biosynthesis protein SpsF
MGEGGRPERLMTDQPVPGEPVPDQPVPGRDKGGILVLARMDSHRLPGKALLDIAGQPMLARVIARLRPASKLGPIVIATSDRAIDNPIAELAASLDVAVFRGDCDDVLGRCLACAAEHELDHILRISGDSPFIASDLVETLWHRYRQGTAEIVTNVHPRSYPAGMSVEVISTAVLAKIAAETRDASDREHVTVHVYRHPECYRIDGLMRTAGDASALRLTVDTAEELAAMRTLAERTTADADCETVIAAAHAIPAT